MKDVPGAYWLGTTLNSKVIKFKPLTRSVSTLGYQLNDCF